jgi:hypothetical protein
MPAKPSWGWWLQKPDHAPQGYRRATRTFPIMPGRFMAFHCAQQSISARRGGDLETALPTSGNVRRSNIQLRNCEVVLGRPSIVKRDDRCAAPLESELVGDRS